MKPGGTLINFCARLFRNASPLGDFTTDAKPELGRGSPGWLQPIFAHQFTKFIAIHNFVYRCGKFFDDLLRCASRRQQAGHDPLPAYQPPAYAGVTGFDLTLLTGIRSLALHHSRFHNHAWARRMKNAPELVIHPATAARLNIGRDDWVWVQTRHKTPRALLKAKLSDEVPSHIVATGMGWWFPELSGPEHGVPLFNIGSSMAYGPEFDPICGSPSESRNTACRIARADPAEIAGLIGQIDTAPTRA